MAACTSIHIFLGRPLFLLSRGIQSIINFGILSSGIPLTWPYHCSLFFYMMSMMSGFPFTPIISFICSFFILSILDILSDLLSTSISVDMKMYFYSSTCSRSVSVSYQSPFLSRSLNSPFRPSVGACKLSEC